MEEKSQEAPEAKKSSEPEREAKKSMRTMILKILDYDKPKKLGVCDRLIEKNKRLATLQYIVLKGTKSLESLRPTLQQTLNLQVNFSIVEIKQNGSVVLKIDEMLKKLRILKERKILRSHGLSIHNYYTDRDSLIRSWLVERQKELKRIGVEAKAVGNKEILINKHKWVWVEAEGKLIETCKMNKF